MIHLQRINFLVGSAATILLRHATRLRHLKGVPRNLGLFSFTDTVPVARNMLVAKQRSNLFQGPSFGLL